MKIKFNEILTDAEKKEVFAEAASSMWAFSPKSIREQLKRYMNGNLKEKAKVCFLFEDCNFHELCGYLAEGKIEEAKRWIALGSPMDEEPIEDDVKEVEAWVMEGSKGKYLHMNSTEDGDGTWFDWTENMFDAYWDKSLDDLKDIAETEFSDFEENYPKYHKVRFTAEVLETAQAD